MRTVQLGELLVRHGAMTSAQRDQVLAAQQSRGGPFGALAEEMFGVASSAVEEAWAEQYSSFAPHIDPRELTIHHRTLEMINRRQAWQFCVLPIQVQGDDLIACTTQERLVRALKFAGWRLGHACQFVLSDAQQLGEAMCKHYPMAGMSPEMLVSTGEVARG